jgi:hypothetical protein
MSGGKVNNLNDDIAMSFNIGDKVEKYTGDYHLEGIIVAKFYTTSNKLRFVIEHIPGFLHIYSENNIRKVV